METDYIDGKKRREQFEKLQDMLKSVEEKAQDPTVKKITIIFPRMKIPSEKKEVKIIKEVICQGDSKECVWWEVTDCFWNLFSPSVVKGQRCPWKHRKNLERNSSTELLKEERKT
jgi:hypothetical protein